MKHLWFQERTLNSNLENGGTILNRLRNAGARVFDIEETYKRYIGYNGGPPEHDFVIVKKYTNFTKGSLDPMSGVKQS
jgi:hypothetical protein